MGSGEWTEVWEARNRGVLGSWLISIKQGVGRVTQCGVLKATGSLPASAPLSAPTPAWCLVTLWEKWLILHIALSPGSQGCCFLTFDKLVASHSFIFLFSKNLQEFFSAVLFIFVSCVIFLLFTVILVKFGWIRKCICFLGSLCIASWPFG